METSVPISKLANGTSAVLLLVLIVANAPHCATVSCATDNGEVSDRVSTMSLTMHAMGSALVWIEKRALAGLASMDISLLLALAILSSDVAPTVHNYVALSFIIVRVILIISISTQGKGFDFLALYLVVCLRSFSQIFMFGYACPKVIPEVCESISAGIPLSQSAALFVEAGTVVCGLGYMIIAADTPSGWKSDSVLPATLVIGLFGNLLIALLGWSLPSLLLLAGGSTIDAALAFRLWNLRDGTLFKCESLPLCAILLAPLVYAFA